MGAILRIKRGRNQIIDFKSGFPASYRTPSTFSSNPPAFLVAFILNGNRHSGASGVV
jgi:hypothetical protein